MFLILQTLDIDIGDSIHHLQNEPFIVVLGGIGGENTQFFICAENALTTECMTLRDALQDLICYYYIFNISYPVSISGVYLFIQHFVFNLKDSQKLPNCLSKLIKNMHA